jgi:hypothetical protein
MPSAAARHRLFHHLVVGNIRAIVGEKRSTSLRKCLEVGDFMPKPPLGDAGRREKECGSAGARE